MYYCPVQRVLVLGSSFSAIEMIKCAKKLGFYVIVCGKNPNEAGHYLGHESIFLDYSDVNQIKKYVEAHKVDYLLPTSNDAAYRTGLELAAEFNFPGFDEYEKGQSFLEKNRFRNVCKEIDLSIPFFRITTARDLMQEQIEFDIPFLIKPAIGFSGIGIIKVENELDREKLKSSNQIEASASSYVIENYIAGTLHSHSAFIEGKRILRDFFVDEFCTINEFAVDSSNHPSKINDQVKEQVRCMIEELLAHMDLVDGLIHTQFMLSDGKAILIESMRRCPGDLFPNLIQLSTGFDYIYNYVAPFLEKPFENCDSQEKSNAPIARFTLATKVDGRIYAIEVGSESSNLVFYPLLKNGDELKPFPLGKAGILFLEFPSTEILFSKVRNFQQGIGILD
jgi:phosphoribosylaminoimidazole carboxylase (NCAIR synthetase)